jgi:hypothetical protein
VKALRPGARGLVLLDAAQRTYAPELTARGKLVLTLDGVSFRRPDGTLDSRAARLLRGVVRQAVPQVVRP